MDVIDLIRNSLNESREYLTRAVNGLTQEELAYAPSPESNSIGFIYWHVVRVEDAWISRIFLSETEVYEAGGWRQKMGYDLDDLGIDYTVERLRDWRVPALKLLNGYVEAVREKTEIFVQNLTPETLTREIDVIGRLVPLGVYLAHFITEIAMHVGQISYLRGVIRGMQPDLRP